MEDNSREIERYLQGKLSPEEEIAFSRRLREDKDFRREVQVAKNQIEEIDVQGMNQTDDSSDDSPHYVFHLSWRVLMIVVSFVVVCILVFRHVKSDPPVLLANEEKMTGRELVGGIDLGQGVVVDLNRMYRKVNASEDLPATIDSLNMVADNFRTKLRDRMEIKLYLAKAYIKLDDYATAKVLLQEVLSCGDTQLANEAQLLYYSIHRKV